MANFTRAQTREWDALTGGKEADLDILERAGLVTAMTKITLVGKSLRKQVSVQLTPAGEALLRAKEAEQPR